MRQLLLIMLISTNGCAVHNAVRNQGAFIKKDVKRVTVFLKDVKMGLYSADDPDGNTYAQFAFDLDKYIHPNTRRALAEAGVSCTVVFGEIKSSGENVDGFTKSYIRDDGLNTADIYIRGGWTIGSLLTFHKDTFIHELLHAVWFIKFTEEERRERETIVLRCIEYLPEKEMLQYGLESQGLDEVWIQIGGLFTTGLYNNATSSNSSISYGKRIKSSQLPVELLESYRGIFRDEFLDVGTE